MEVVFKSNQIKPRLPALHFKKLCLVSNVIQRSGDISGKLCANIQSFKILNERDPRTQWATVHEQTFISQCQWCEADGAPGGSSLAGLAVRDKVSEMGGGQEVRVTPCVDNQSTWFRVLGEGGTSTLCKHICTLVPEPVKAGTLSNFCLGELFERTAPCTPGYFHQSN